MKLVFLTTILIINFFNFSDAAIPKNSPTKSLTVQGGEAGVGFSIIGAQLSSLKKGKRLVFDIGDQEGRKFIGRPGYYFAEFSKESRELRLDFRQMGGSQVKESEIKKLLMKTQLIESFQMVLDPTDLTTAMIFKLKPKVAVKVIEVKGQKQTAKVALDFVRL